MEGSIAWRERDDEGSEKGGGEGSEEQREESGRGSEPCGDHGDEFDVAHAEAFVVADEEIEPADEEQEQGGGECGKGRFARIPDMVPQSAWLKGIVKDAEHDTGECEGIGEAHGFSVHDGEAEQ